MTTPSMLLQGQTALVTGAGRGIGRAAALALAGAGAGVVLAARTASELASAQADIEAQGGRALSVPLDVADRRAAEAAVQAAEAAFGAVDILVQAAGMIGPIGPFTDIDAAAWRHCLDVNLLGSFNMAQSVLGGMLRRNHGRIIMLSSLIASRAFPRFSAYAVSKAGVDHLVRSLAAELEGTGVAVNAVYPGMTDTAMQTEIREAPPEQIGGGMWQYYHDAWQQGRLLNPEVPARLILFLASPLAKDVRGQIVPIESSEAQGWLGALAARQAEGG